jgi:hypothetical protein
VLTVISCPDCGVPAEITECFSLASSDGPVAHVAVCCAAGHHFRMAADRLAIQAPKRPLPPARGLRNMLRAGMLPRPVQLCIHCRENPAGFWVSRHDGQVARRPWCLSCCAELDPGRCAVIPFAS